MGPNGYGRGHITPTLIAQARQGSGTALDQLLKSCWNYLLLIANEELRREVRAKVGASDIAQETLS